MSGGSFNYLYGKDTVEYIINSELLSALKSIVDRIKELGYGDVADDIDMLIGDITDLIQVHDRVETFRDKLSPVLKEIEWYDSLDGSIEAISSSVTKYRKRKSEE